VSRLVPNVIPQDVRVARAMPNSQRGLSLIEIMVALAIAAILLLGLSQIFVGSKNVYRLQEGMARVQENARFALQYLEENVRMAGYMGCGNDVDLTTHAGSPPSYLNHLAARTSAIGAVPLTQTTMSYPQHFERPIEAFTYTGGSIDGQPPSFGGQGDWTPRLPDDLLGTLNGGDLSATFAKGSDIIVMRLVRPESTAMIGDFNMAGSFSVADPSMVKAGNVYALTNCSNARIFLATAGGSGVNPIVAGLGPTRTGNPLFLTAGATSTWTGTYANMQFNQSGNALNAEVHPADYIVLYVGIRNPATDNAPVLMIQGGPDGRVAPQELVDDVEVMRAWFGVDTSATGAGDVTKFVGADNTDAEANLAATDAVQRSAEWRKVLSVRLALLMRSPDRASAAPHNGDAPGDNVFKLFDARVQAPNDSRYRDVFSTTVALRNRLSNY
jgi:type IV pilus assembly protein PilW